MRDESGCESCVRGGSVFESCVRDCSIWESGYVTGAFERLVNLAYVAGAFGIPV